jgi:hypothetical protein
MLDRKTAHVEHLEKLVAYRDGIIAERDVQVQALSARNADIERQAAELGGKLAESQAVVAAQERIIEYRRQWRWWAMLPLLKLRTAWRRLRGE